MSDYDTLIAEKLELLLCINEQEVITWKETKRLPLKIWEFTYVVSKKSYMARCRRNSCLSCKSATLGLLMAVDIYIQVSKFF
jgi:hypothetical protein